MDGEDLVRLSWRVYLAASVVAVTVWAQGLNREAKALPNLTGTTGLIKIPSAETLSSGDLAIGFSWIGGARGYLFRPATNRFYYASMGLLPGLEVSISMLQVVGWRDPDAPGVANAFHRLSNLKYSPSLPQGWPRLAIGLQDPVSINALTRGPEGQTRYGLTTVYGVMSQPAGPLTFHIGYGHGSSLFQGVFGGVDWYVDRGLNLRLECDTQAWNVGVHWQPLPWFGLYAARLFPDDSSYGTVIVWHL